MDLVKKYHKLIAVVIIMILLLSACGITPEEIAATQTWEAKTEGETQTAKAPTVTNTPLPTATPTATLTPTATPDKTATAMAQATVEAQSMLSKIQGLYDNGNLSSTEGVYYGLPDFSETFAQINYVRPYLTSEDYFWGDFVLSANIAWETAREGANIRFSGCAFYFGVDEEFENYYVSILSLDGIAKTLRSLNGGYLQQIAYGGYTKMDYMQGDADIVLVFEDGTISFFVNGKLSYSKPNQKEFEGYFGYGISSGTNAGFGTRCTFSNVEIWELNP